MKNIVATTLMIFTLVLASGCKKEDVKDGAKAVLCESGKVAASVVALQVSQEKYLNCKNVPAVQSHIEEKLVSLKICEKKEEEKSLVGAQSIVGDIVCTSVIEGLFAGSMNALPAEWECSGGQLAQEAKMKLIESCANAL